MMQICSMPLSIASSPMIWMIGLVSPSRSTSGNISFWTAVEAGYCRVPRPAAVMTAFRTLAMAPPREERKLNHRDHRGNRGEDLSTKDTKGHEDKRWRVEGME